MTLWGHDIELSHSLLNQVRHDGRPHAKHCLSKCRFVSAMELMLAARLAWQLLKSGGGGGDGACFLRTVGCSQVIVVTIFSPGPSVLMHILVPDSENLGEKGMAGGLEGPRSDCRWTSQAETGYGQYLVKLCVTGSLINTLLSESKESERVRAARGSADTSASACASALQKCKKSAMTTSNGARCVTLQTALLTQFRGLGRARGLSTLGLHIVFLTCLAPG